MIIMIIQSEYFATPGQTKMKMTDTLIQVNCNDLSPLLNND
jgi:hypothetical protein